MNLRSASIALALVSSVPAVTLAAPAISEIMYDPEGADTGREWIEIYNDGDDADLTGWKFFEEGTNHGLSVTQGNAVVKRGERAIIADNSQKFLVDFPGYAGTLFDSSFSLKNTGETLSLKDKSLVIVDTVSYDPAWGAAGDGASLQKIGAAFSGAAPTPGEAPPSAAPAASSSPEVSAASSTVPSASSATSWPVDPQVFANAGADRIAVVGADTLFEGKAFGLEKKPLENARFIWNFGDGVTREGARVFHAYSYPGTYVVVLDVASGYFSGSDRATVTVEDARIRLRRISRAGTGFLEVSNASNYELDLSLWLLRQGTSTWSLPARTIVPGGRSIAFADAVTGFSFEAGAAELLYPNGAVAATENEGPHPLTVVSSPSETASTPPPFSRNFVPATPVEAYAVPTSSQAAALGNLPPSIKWYAGLFGIVVVGLAGLWLARRAPMPARVAPPSDTR